jgi:3-hydroxyacyl-[acyl-carrier-protein] dehydratase
LYAAYRSLPRPSEVLPHGEAFRFVDTVIALCERHIVATRLVPLDEPWTTAHFPSVAIVPGVLLIEGMAQTCGILARSFGESVERSGAGRLTAVRNARFRLPVVPGSLLIYRAELLVRAGPLYSFRATTSVGDSLIAEVELLLHLGPLLSAASTPSVPGDGS